VQEADEQCALTQILHGLEVVAYFEEFDCVRAARELDDLQALLLATEVLHAMTFVKSANDWSTARSVARPHCADRSR
jgi:hypothetical protein